VSSTERKNISEFSERNIFEILNEKYGADTKGEYTFINQAGKGVIDYALLSERLISGSVEFRTCNEIIINHMPLLAVTESMLQRNVNTESIVEKTTHKLVKYKWDERAVRVPRYRSYVNKYCTYGINFLQKRQD
jgi:hypothetical protein